MIQGRERSSRSDYYFQIIIGGYLGKDEKLYVAFFDPEKACFRTNREGLRDGEVYYINEVICWGFRHF